MSNEWKWRVKKEAPSDYLHLLCEQEMENEGMNASKSDINDEEDIVGRPSTTTVAPPNFPSSLHCRDSGKKVKVSKRKSRAPIRLHQTSDIASEEVVEQIYDGNQVSEYQVNIYNRERPRSRSPVNRPHTTSETVPGDIVVQIYDGNDTPLNFDADQGSEDKVTSPNRDRSRSPIRLHQTLESADDDVVVEIYDSDDTPFKFDGDKDKITISESETSPIWLHQTSESADDGVVVQIYDGDGTPLKFIIDQNSEVFLSPDAHTMFALSENGMDDRNSRGRGMGVQKRGRAVRGRRGGPRGNRGQGRLELGRKRRTGPRWEVGHPLNEIWLSDEDVPADFVSILTDVMRNRELSMQKRNGSKILESDDEEDNEQYHEEDDDEFFDAVDVTDEKFEWSSMESFDGKEEVFLPKRTGATKIYKSAYDAFRSYWDDDILGLIVSETNQYASKIGSPSFQSEWYKTNLHEILCLFAFWMMLGVIKMPTITSCFSTDPLLKTEIFRQIFTIKRYQNLSRALHFIENDAYITANHDRLHCLRPIISHLNLKFQSNYILDKDICIDESLTLWKGRLDIKQYIKTKAAKFGIKTYELCESVTGYLWSFIVYSGKGSSIDLENTPGTVKSTEVVKTLVAPLLHKGHRIFMDNFYNSPLLARFLKRNGTDCVGTLKPTRKYVPAIVNKAPLKRGDIIARHSGDVTVLSWQDKKRVTMISTCHGSSTALPNVSSRNKSRPVPFKPKVVLDYNKFMGGVDLKDQMLEPYLLERKRCSKWYMKLFKRLLNVSILNARTLLQSSTQKHQDHLAFRLQLVDSILINHRSHCPEPRMYTRSSRVDLQHVAKYNPYGHWPTLRKTASSSSEEKRRIRKACVVCSRAGRITIRTAFYCEMCQVSLCVTRDCFKSFHM